MQQLRCCERRFTMPKKLTGYKDGYPILLRYQELWNKEEADIAVCEKSRRIGLSYGDAAGKVMYVAAGKGDVYYMSYNKDMTETYINDCVDWAKKYGDAADLIQETVIENEREILKFRLKFASGKSIIALPSNPRALRSKGKPGDIVDVDEAAFCEDLSELLKAVIAITQWGGKVRIFSTHNGDDSAYCELIKDIRAGRLKYALHRITLDDAIADGLARRIFTVKNSQKPPEKQEKWNKDYEKKWRAQQIAKYPDSDMADEELFCIPRLSAESYFPSHIIENCMQDMPIFKFAGGRNFNESSSPTQLAITQDWITENLTNYMPTLNLEYFSYFGMDFARSGDLSVITVLQVEPNLKLRTVLYVEISNCPHLCQQLILHYILNRLPRFCGGAIDAGGNGSFSSRSNGGRVWQHSRTS